jgi:hypothetical protein
MIYRGLFNEYLRERIAAGGRVEEIVRLVNAYQGSDVDARSEEFAAWLENNRHDCARCDRTFSVGSPLPSENDDPLCTACAVGYFFRMTEPMPGWNKTWSR